MKFFYTLLIVFFAGIAINSQTIANFDFEGGLPDNWVGENTWKVGTAAALGSDYFTFQGNATSFAGTNDDVLGGGGNASGRLITDFLDFTAYPNVLLSMDLYYFHANYDGAGQETLNIFYSEDGTTWTLIDPVEEGYVWNRYTYAVSKSIGGKNVKIAFEYKDGNNWSYGAGIDNILFEVQPQYAFLSIPPVNSIKVVDSPEEVVSFDYGVLSLGFIPVVDFKLRYSIDSLPVLEIKGVDTVYANETFTFEIPDFMLGKHTLYTTIVVNDTLEFDNFPVELEVAPPIPHYIKADVENIPFDIYADLLDGKAVLLDFFASWCGPCQTSTPIINKVWEKYGMGTKKFQIYGITIESSDNAAVIKGLNWGGLYPKFAYSDQNEMMWSIFNSKYGEGAIPLFTLICPDTNNVAFSPVTWTMLGVQPTLEADLESAVAACVGDIIAYDDIDLGNISIYPNPVKDKLSISMILNERLDASVYIIDQTGRKIKNITQIENNNSLKYAVDLSELNAGIYYLKIDTKYGVKTEKIIKL